MMDYDIRHGRTYMYSHVEPQFPFGYGLSYATFVYAGLRRRARRGSSRASPIDVSVDVTNDGSARRRRGGAALRALPGLEGLAAAEAIARLPCASRSTRARRARSRSTSRPRSSPSGAPRSTPGWSSPATSSCMVGPSSADADLKLRHDDRGRRRLVDVQVHGARLEAPLALRPRARPISSALGRIVRARPGHGRGGAAAPRPAGRRARA